MKRTAEQQAWFVKGLEAAYRSVGIIERCAREDGWASPNNASRRFTEAAALRTARERIGDRIRREKAKGKNR